MRDIVDISHAYTQTTTSYYFDITLDAEEIILPGGEVTIDGETYEGILNVMDSDVDRDEELEVIFNDDIDDELYERLEKLVLDQFYRMDTNNN